MFNNIISYSVYHSKIIVFIFIILSFFGFKLIEKNNFDAIPDLSDKQVIVEINYPSSSPKTIEEQITYPLTQKLISVPNTKTVRGFSFVNKSYIYIIFEDNVDLYWARSRVLEYLNSAESILPQNATYNLGSDASGVGWIYQYALIDKTNTFDIEELTRIQNWELKQKLESVKGVAEIATVGGFNKEFRITINPFKLISYNITINDVINSIKSNNNEVGGGLLEQGEKEFLIQSNGLITEIEDIKNIVIKYNNETKQGITLSDVGFVVESAKSRRGLAELNGQGEVIGGIVVMRYNENPLNVINNIKNKIKEIKKTLPKEVELVSVYDRSTLINKSIDNLENKIIKEIIIISLVCFILFLSISSSIVIIITMPVSLLISFIFTYFMNINLNIMSLAGLAISIGVVTDSAIVMIDNVYRKCNKFNKKEILNACKEVAPSLFFSLFIITISFMPLFMLTGQESKMFEPLVITKSLIMGISTLLTITLIPALITIFIRKPIKSEKEHFLFKPFIYLYKNIIEFLVKFKFISIIITVLVVGYSAFIIKDMNYEFIPELNEGDLLYMPTTQPSISVSEAQKLLQTTDKLIKQIPEVKTVFGKIGRAETSTDPAPMTMLETTIQLKDKSEWRDGYTIKDIINDLDNNVQIPSLRNAWIQPIKTRIDMLSTGIKSPIALKISGKNINDITNNAILIESKIQNIDNIKSVYAEKLSKGSYLNIYPKRNTLNSNGITINEFQNYIQYLLGNSPIDTLYIDRERYDVSLEIQNKYTSNINTINNTPLYLNGSYYLLNDLAEVKVEDYPTVIKSENSELVSYIYIYLKDNNYEKFKNEADLILEELSLNNTYFEWIGDYNKLENSKEKFSIIIPLILLIILFIVYSLFNSGYIAFVNLLGIFFSLSGAIILLNIYNFNLSISTAVGFIALSGLTIELSILMSLYIKNEEKNKVVNGAVKRLRPKLTTALTIILSLIPIMYSMDTGSEFLINVIAPMYYGIIFSFIYVLFILPVLLSFYFKD
tara:strand:+ start:8098 stop:11127 length:3030 start_codon:yes stop_codon:yes gene_type:complete